MQPIHKIRKGRVIASIWETSGGFYVSFSKQIAHNRFFNGFYIADFSSMRKVMEAVQDWIRAQG